MMALLPSECAIPQMASDATVAVLPFQNCRLAAVPALPSQARCPQSAPPMLPSDTAEPMPSQVAVSAADSNLPSCSQPGAPVPGELPAGAPPMLPSTAAETLPSQVAVNAAVAVNVPRPSAPWSLAP